MKRIIFVGLHNKPGMKPLDSKSKSGKLIDRIAEKCRHHGMNVLKTNLYDVDYMPGVDDISLHHFEWVERVQLFKDDVIVLLGATVHKNFPYIALTKTIKIAHPASKYSHKEMDEYVEKSFKLIKTYNDKNV